MKRCKHLAAIWLSALALLLLLPTQALAAGIIDLEHDVSLTIVYQDGSTPLSGAQFDIYFVAAVDKYGELTPTEAFAQYNVNIRGENDEAWRTLASTLEGYVLRDKLAPADSGKTNAQGVLTFPSAGNRLTPGLYLVLGHSHWQNGRTYQAAPFMVLLPGRDREANDWDYDVTANAKHDSDPDPVPGGTDTSALEVLKVWKDEGHESQRPQQVVVQLLRDGEVYDTVTLSAANNWRHIWTDLERGHRWTVAERELASYTVEVTREGVTFVVTNTYGENNQGGPDGPNEPGNPGGPDTPGNSGGTDGPGSPSLPQTGQLWWPVPLLAAAGLLLIVLGLLRRRGAGT